MRKIFIFNVFIIFCFFFSLNIFSNTKYELLDRVIAYAEKEVITQNELDKKFLKLKQIKSSRNILINEKEIRKEALNNLIEQKVISQYARSIGIEVSQEEIEFVINNILSNNNITIDDLKKDLSNNNDTVDEFKKEIENNLIIKKIKEREIIPYINISKNEVDALFKKNAKKKLAKLEYKIIHILIKDNFQKNEKIEKVLKKINNNNFREVAKKESDGPFAENGGDLGWNKLEDLPALFSDKVVNMNVGEIATIFSPAGTHIIKLDEIKNQSDDKKKFLSEYKFQQVFLKKNKINSDDEYRRKLENIKNLINNGLEFKDAVKKFSEEVLSSNSDLLEWINIHNLLPEFREKFNKYPNEKLIGPFKTELGWHLLYIYDYRERDVTNETNIEAAKLELINYKTELRFNDWKDALLNNSKIQIIED